MADKEESYNDLQFDAKLGPLTWSLCDSHEGSGSQEALHTDRSGLKNKIARNSKLVCSSLVSDSISPIFIYLGCVQAHYLLFMLVLHGFAYSIRYFLYSLYTGKAYNYI